MLEQYGKVSHQESLQSALRLKEKLAVLREIDPLATRAFQANAMDSQAILRYLQPKSVDIVFTDVPYGWHSQWQNADLGVSGALRSMLDALLGVLSPSSIVAISSDKQQKAVHERYQRVEQLQVGKRRVTFLKTI